MTRWKQRALVLALLVAAGLAGWISAGGPPPLPLAGGDAVAEATALSSEQFYALTFADAEGRPQRLEQWRGKLLVVNFWATWCTPCRKEIPDFAAVSQEYAARGVQFVGLGVDTADNIARFGRDRNVPYPLLVAGTGSLPIMSSLGNASMALPFTLIVDGRGQVRLRQLGPMNGDRLRASLERMLRG